MFGKFKDKFNKMEYRLSVLWNERMAFVYNPKVELKYVNKSANEDIKYAKPGDSGFDLRAWINKDGYPEGKAFTKESSDGDLPWVWCVEIPPHERMLIHTGLYVELPEHTELQVRPRSGESLKRGLVVANSPGTVDYGYRGEVCVIALNTTNEPIIVEDGERIAQAVLIPVYNSFKVDLVKVDEINKETERGDGGFGHTGK